MANGVPIWDEVLQRDTNADRIRSMTDEELADWLNKKLLVCPFSNLEKRCPDIEDESCKDCLLEWLRQENDT